MNAGIYVTNGPSSTLTFTGSQSCDSGFADGARIVSEMLTVE